MVYMGSKSRIARFIVPIIQEKVDKSNSKIYFEPFAGGCNVIDKIKADRKIASDKNEYLIALFKYLQAGGQLPEEISRCEYSAVREDYKTAGGKYPQWYIGAVGFLSSFSGKFFGGYSGDYHDREGRRNKTRYSECRSNILKQVQNVGGGISDIEFLSGDYRDYNPVGMVIYCDPPYSKTTPYANTRAFNHDEFWQTMRNWSKNNVVIISELNAPDDFRVIWERETERCLNVKRHFMTVEKLFTWGGDVYSKSEV